MIVRARWVVLACVFALLSARSLTAATLSDVDRSISKYLTDGQADRAAALVSQAFALARTEYAGDSLAVAVYADSLGIRFFEARDFATGVVILEHGVALRESVLPQDDLALAGPLEQLATAYYIADRLADAVAPQERALAIRARALGAGDPGVASSRYELSLVYYRLTRYADAERELRAALAAFEPRRDEDPMKVAETERVLGEVCRETNRYAEAEQRMSDALALAQISLPERDPELVVFLNSVAGLYKDQARYDEAEPLLEEDIDIRTRAGLEDELATPTLNLAEVYRLQGRYEDAIPLYQRALGIAQKTMPPLEVSEFQNQIASAYVEMGRLDDAETQYRQALAAIGASPDASPQVVAQFKNDLGVLLARASRAAEGEALLEEAIALRERVFGPRHPLVAVSLTQLARARAGMFEDKPSGDDDRGAERLLDRALAIFDSTNAEPETRVDAGVARAQLYARARHVDRAVATMARALDVVETLRPHRGGGGGERTEFVRRYVDAYDQMTEWQLQLNHVPAALEYSERRRARVLVDRLTGSARGSATGGADVRERLRVEKAGFETRLGELQAQITALRAKPRLSAAERSELAAAEEKRDHLVDDIERAGERLRRLDNPGEGAPAGTVPAPITVAKGEALLAYHIGTRSSDVFVIEGGSSRVRAYPLVVADTSAVRLGIPAGPLTRAALARLLSGADAAGQPTGKGIVRELSEPALSTAPNSIMERARSDMHARLHAVFALLLPPNAWKSAHAAREVTIVPDGPLATFPFEACVVRVEAADRAVFWIDDGPAVRYAPSIATLDALTRVAQAAGAGGVLSVCNPTYALSGPGALAPLPATVRESDAVVSAFGKDRVTVLSGDAATEAAVRRALPGKAIVHLATHGLVDQRRSDLLAALAFTPAASSPHDLRDDGFLHLFEIYDLSVAAQLVVLSACESSTGNFVLGEGVMAMSRGFLSAGARRVVATEWKVDDDATAALVGDFLARVARGERAHGGVDYAVALRDAKRAVRRSQAWSQPFYWAAFVLTGVR